MKTTGIIITLSSLRRIVSVVLVINIIFIGCKKNDDIDNENDPEISAEKVNMMFMSSRERDGNGDLVKHLTAFNPDGTIKWEKTGIGNIVAGSAAYADGIIYLTDPHFAFINGGPDYESYSNLYAIDANTGMEIWSQTHSDEYKYYPVVRNDTLFCSTKLSSQANIAAYNAKTGALYWKTRIGFPLWPANLFLDGNTLFFVVSPSSMENNVIAFDINTKTIKWNVPMGVNIGDAYSEFCSSDDKIFIKSGTGVLMALNKASGQLIWSKPGMNAPFVYQGKVYVIGGDSGIHVYDADSGNELWQWNASGGIYIGGNPYVAGSKVILTGSDASGQRFIKCFNAASGNLLWDISPNELCQYPVVVGNTLFALKNHLMNTQSTNSKIALYDIATGQPKDSIMLAEPSVVDAFGGLYVVGTSGKVYKPNNKQ